MENGQQTVLTLTHICEKQNNHRHVDLNDVDVKRDGLQGQS